MCKGSNISDMIDPTQELHNLTAIQYLTKLEQSLDWFSDLIPLETGSHL
jgi:hypothetical protein